MGFCKKKYGTDLYYRSSNPFFCHKEPDSPRSQKGARPLVSQVLDPRRGAFNRWAGLKVYLALWSFLGNGATGKRATPKAAALSSQSSLKKAPLSVHKETPTPHRALFLVKCSRIGIKKPKPNEMQRNVSSSIFLYRKPYFFCNTPYVFAAWIPYFFDKIPYFLYSAVILCFRIKLF